MGLLQFSTMFGLMLASGAALAACAPLRLGYVDQHRPPYYMGSGTEEAAPAGASIDLIREIGAAAGCRVITVRLPHARLRSGLKAGTIDAMSIEASESDTALYALPLDATGRLDTAKSVRSNTVMFVRAYDTGLHNMDPSRDFGQRWIGVNHAAPLAAALRQQGFRVDDGALDSERNLEKLVRNRIDGFAVTVSSVGDMDAWVAAKYGNSIVRLDRPMSTHNIYLGISNAYYARNRKHVDAMWAWIGENGRSRFARIIRTYDK